MTWGVATALLDAGRDARADRPVRGRRGLAARRGARRCARGCCCWPTSSATSSTATASSSRSPTAGPSSLAGADAPRRARAERRRPARGRPRPRPRGRDLLRPRGRLAGAARAAARRRLEALPQLRHRLPSTTPSTSATWAATAARAAAASARAPQVAATRVELEGMSRLADRAAHPAGRARRCASRSRASTTSTTPSPPWPPRSSSACRSRPAGEALESFGGAFGRVETIAVGGRELSILLVKNPAGANEVLRTLTLEDGSLDLWLALNDRIADGRDVSWIWDADFELLRGRVRRVTARARAPRRWRVRLKYAELDAEIAVERDLGRSLDAALDRRRGLAAVRPAHLHGAARAARPAVPARAGRPVVGVRSSAGRLARRGVRLLRRRPRRSGASSPRAAGGPGARPRLRHRPGGARPGRARPRGDGGGRRRRAGGRAGAPRARARPAGGQPGRRRAHARARPPLRLRARRHAGGAAARRAVRGAWP